MATLQIVAFVKDYPVEKANFLLRDRFWCFSDDVDQPTIESKVAAKEIFGVARTYIEQPLGQFFGIPIEGDKDSGITMSISSELLKVDRNVAVWVGDWGINEFELNRIRKHPDSELSTKLSFLVSLIALDTRETMVNISDTPPMNYMLDKGLFIAKVFELLNASKRESLKKELKGV